MEGDYEEVEYPEYDGQHDDMQDADVYDDELEDGDYYVDDEHLELGEECVPEKSDNPSTYESISDLKMDKPNLQSVQAVTGAVEGAVPYQAELHEADQRTGGGNSEACISADMSSMSYNTVPEELFPDISVGTSADFNAATDVEDEEMESDEESDGINEDEPPEAHQEASSRSRERRANSKQNSKSSKKRPRASKLATSRRSKTYSSKKLKSKQRVVNKPIEKRHLIKPATEPYFDPDAPQRPLTAFKLFMNEFRGKYSTQYPNIPFSEMTDIGAEVWRDMSAHKKLEFQKEAKLKQDEYLNKMREYQSKKHQERSAKPKTAYQIFMSDYLNKEYEKRKNLKTQSRLTKQDLFMRGVRKWNRMTKNQKVIYEAQSRITKNTQVECTESSPQTSTVFLSLPPSPNTLSPREKYIPPLTEPTPPKKHRTIEFSEEDEVVQFRDDDTMETWYQASKGF